MPAKDLVSREITPLRPEQTAAEALLQMEELKVNALPLVNQEQFISLITEDKVTNTPSNNLLSQIEGTKLSVLEGTHIFDVIERFAQSTYDVLPVVDENEKYVGTITHKTLLRQIATLCDTSRPGAIIQIEIAQQDYMLSDLARIAEQNNIYIINFLTYPDEHSGKLHIFIKVNSEDATYFLRSLERFNYHVIAHYHHDIITDEMIQERLKEVLYYIEM